MADSSPAYALTADEELAAREELAPVALLGADIPEPVVARLSPARERLLTRLREDEDARADGRGPRVHKARGGRRPRVTARRVLAVAVVALITAGGLFALDTLHPSGQGGASAEAASLLEQAAVQSMTRPDPVAGPNQYLLTTSRVVIPTAGGRRSVSFLIELTVKTWVPGDATRPWVRWSSGAHPIRFFSGADETYARQEGLLSGTYFEPSLARGRRRVR